MPVSGTDGAQNGRMKNKKENTVDFSAMRRRSGVLENARETLKDEFVGLDPIIDGIVDTLRSWFLVPELQRRPLVVNLWGMTGVGKTALVERLAELLEYSDRYYRYTMDSDKAGAVLADQLGELGFYEGGDPFIATLDEFQKCRTIDENGAETDRESAKVLWDFLDTGSLPMGGMGCFRDLETLFELDGKIADCLRDGVRVEKGRVVGGLDAYRQIMEGDLAVRRVYGGPQKVDTGAPDTRPRFIPDCYLQELCSYAAGLFQSERDAKRALENLDGRETHELVDRIWRKTLRPRTTDGSRALVFVIGNLDEVYTMSGEFNPDMRADDFRDLSRKITLPMVKNALRRRFRSEQIARLGNIHFIYPAFGEAEYREIIRRKFRRMEEDFRGAAGRRISFGAPLEDLVYREGVYPSLGVRPVLSTIHRIAASRLGDVCAEIGLRDLETDEIVMSHADGRIRTEFLRGGEEVFRLECPHVPELENLRAPRRDDAQAVVAVHEAGHAALSYLLLGLLPETVRSVSAGAGAPGFTRVKDNPDYIRRGELRERIAVYLGGFAAEEMVFGAENVTSGAAGDIDAATRLAASGLKVFGFGEVPAAYSVADAAANHRVHDDGKINAAVENLVREGGALARETLRKNRGALLAIADILADASSVGREALSEIFRRRRAEEGPAGFPYRERLKAMTAGRTADPASARAGHAAAECVVLNSGPAALSNFRRDGL